MTRPRPTVVTVFATLNIVFGRLGLLCGLCMGLVVVFVGAAIPQAPAPPAGEPNPLEWLKAIDRAEPSVKFVLLGMVVSHLVLSLCAVIGGIGMLGLKTWARPFVIMVAFVSVIGTIASQVYSLLVMNPALEAAIPQMAGPNAPPPPPQDNTMQLLQTVFGTMVAVAYQVALLFVMYTPTVVEAFRPPRYVDPYDSYGGQQ